MISGSMRCVASVCVAIAVPQAVMAGGGADGGQSASLQACGCKHIGILIQQIKSAARKEMAFSQVNNVLQFCERDPDNPRCSGSAGNSPSRLYKHFYDHLEAFVAEKSVVDMGPPASFEDPLTGPVADRYRNPPLTAGTATTDRILQPTPALQATATGSVYTLTFNAAGSDRTSDSVHVVNGVQVGSAPAGMLPSDFKKRTDANDTRLTSYLPPDHAARRAAYLADQRLNPDGSGRALCDWKDVDQQMRAYTDYLKQANYCREFVTFPRQHEERHAAQCRALDFWGFVNSPSSTAALHEAQAYAEEAQSFRKLLLKILAEEVVYEVSGTAIVHESMMDYRHGYEMQWTPATNVALVGSGEGGDELRVVISFETSSRFIVHKVHDYDSGQCTAVNPPATVRNQGEVGVFAVADDVISGGFLHGETATYEARCRLSNGNTRTFLAEIPTPGPQTGQIAIDWLTDGRPVPFGDVQPDNGDGTSYQYFLRARCKAR